MAFRFSIRTALVTLTLAAGFSLILAQAVRGEPWALGVVIGFGSLAAAFVPGVAWYWVVRLVGAMLPDTPPASRAAAPAPPIQEA